jgi:EspA/EspE family
MTVIGELIEGVAGRAGLENIREVGERLTKSDRAGEVVEKLPGAVGSDLLDYGKFLITRLKNTTGQRDPENGGGFGQARTAFNGVNETLKSAVPGNGWDGSSSYAYADQNTRQQLRSEAMADADHEVHKVLYREAAQITLRRGYLDDQYNFLANTSYVTFELQFIPRYGEAMKMAVEIAALQTALGESYHQITQLQSEVAQNAADLQQAVGRYSGVADGAGLAVVAMNFDPPPGGGARPGTSPIERPQQSVTPSGSAGPSDVCRPMVTPGETTAPVRAEREPNSDRLQAPVAAGLDSHNRPGPPAGTPPEDGR